jgi:glycosyltransferase involved in cell wall biosynthesis
MLSAGGRIHADLLRQLVFGGDSVTAVAWGHDVDYLSPGEEPSFFVDPVSVPIIPISDKTDPTVGIVEAMQGFSPDIMVTIGDADDFLFMKRALPIIGDSFRWMFILVNYRRPFNYDKQELLQQADGILCTNSESYGLLKRFYYKDELSFQLSGCSNQFCPTEASKKDQFRIMTVGKNIQSDNLPSLIEVVAGLQKHANIELYVHTNHYDRGYYDFEDLRHRFDPDERWLLLPNEYISNFDGCVAQDLNQRYADSDLYVSVAMMSATSRTCLEALAAGCPVLMADHGSYRDVAWICEKFGYEKERILVRCTKFMSSVGSYLYVCDQEDLSAKIMWFYKNREAGLAQVLCEVRADAFSVKAVEMMKRITASNRSLCVETC